MSAFIAWRFPIRHLFACCFVRVLMALFPCYLSIRIFCYVLFVPIFCSKIVLFPCHPVVDMSPCIHSLLTGWIFFRCFGMSVLSVLFYPVSISFWSSFFRQYILIYFFESNFLSSLLCCFSLFVQTYSSFFLCFIILTVITLPIRLIVILIALISSYYCYHCKLFYY